MIHYPFEDGSKSQPIVPTEGSRKANDGDLVRGRGLRCEVLVGMLYARVEVRENTAVACDV